MSTEQNNYFPPRSARDLRPILRGGLREGHLCHKGAFFAMKGEQNQYGV